MIASIARRASAAVIVLLVIAVPAAMATFNSPRSATATYSTATLSAPTSLSASPGPCTLSVRPVVTLSWTATPSTWADGYEVRRSLLSGGPYTTVGTVSGVNTTTYNDTTALFSTLYRYVVRATKGSWRSANSNEAAITTFSPLCF